MPPLFQDDKSPRWVWIPAISGALGGLATRAVPLADTAHVYQAWAMVLVPLVAMGVLARSWHRRLPVTPHELEYVRLGIGVLTIVGAGGIAGGAIPLTLVAGPAFFIWTVAERRRTPHTSA